MNLVKLITETAARYPGKTAMVDGLERISYGELLNRIDAYASALMALGAVKGDLIGIQLPNSIDYVVFTYAVWKTGAIVVPIGMEMKAIEVDAVCRQMNLTALIAANDNPVSARAIAGTGCCFIPGKTPGRFPESDAAFVRFTSGTTGSFKGVVLSHHGICERIQAVDAAFQIGPRDRVLWLLSMAHHFVSTIVLYLSRGACIVLAKGHLPGAMTATAAKEKVSVIYASPFHYALMASDASQAALSSVRLAVSTTIHLPAGVQDRFVGRFGVPISQAYGLIELGLVCVNTDDPAGKSGSVGKVLPAYRIDIRNNAVYEPGADRCGEIYFKGPGFFDGYFSPYKNAGDIMADGWFDTGDIGRIDPDGYIYLVGRKKELVNVGGMKVFPREVEAALDQHPLVRESRVYSLEDTYSGEVVAADVVATDGTGLTSRDLAAHCRGRLSAYKIPNRFNFVDIIRKTPVTSKIVRA